MKRIVITILSLLLFACNGSSTLKTTVSDSAFRNAVRNGEVSLVKEYLDEGYEVNSPGMAGENALHEGILHYEVARLLIERGSAVDQRNKFNGSTPLIVSCIAGNVEDRTVEILLKSGANPSIKDVHGNTALDYAREYGFEDKSDLLENALKQKAEPAAGENASRPTA